MQDNRGEKMPLYEGKDGKLYYNFALGLKVQMHGNDCDKSANYTYKIVGCHYIGTTEYYDVEIDGVQQPQPNSANRVKYLISRFGVRTLYSGERQELPLTVEEVKAYFSYREGQHAAAQREVSKLTEYVALKMSANALAPQIAYAEAYGRTAEAEALETELEALEERANNELIAHGIDPKDVAEPARCPKCGGKGYVFNHICECAIPHTQEIKDFNAKRRLKLSKILRG